MKFENSKNEKIPIPSDSRTPERVRNPRDLKKKVLSKCTIVLLNSGSIRRKEGKQCFAMGNRSAGGSFH